MGRIARLLVIRLGVGIHAHRANLLQVVRASLGRGFVDVGAAFLVFFAPRILPAVVSAPPSPTAARWAG
jgi:hypothetical protein